MKKITRPLIAALILAIACSLTTGCSKKESEKENQELHVSEKLLSEEERQAYMSQMPLSTSTEEDREIDPSVEIKITEKVDDPTVDWSYFDKIYSDTLSRPKKQDMAFILLCKKDLIGEVNKHPENTKLVTALKKYVDVLVTTEYIGYTSLYYALQTLKPVDAAYVKEKAAAILRYAKNDTFHTDYINDKGNMEKEKDTYDKIVENFKYIPKIATLQ